MGGPRSLRQMRWMHSTRVGEECAGIAALFSTAARIESSNWPWDGQQPSRDLIAVCGFDLLGECRQAQQMVLHADDCDEASGGGVGGRADFFVL